jgi:chaperonin cofactor prefoldin
MEQVFLTDEEYQKISNLQTNQSNLFATLGQVEYQLQFLNTQKTELLSQLKELDGKNEEIGKELQDKYGNGTINMETKEFVKTS